jgi:hypothetical protein
VRFGKGGAPSGVLGGTRILISLLSAMGSAKSRIPNSVIESLASLDDARALSVVFGDIFKG